MMGSLDRRTFLKSAAAAGAAVGIMRPPAQRVFRSRGETAVVQNLVGRVVVSPRFV